MNKKSLTVHKPMKIPPPIFDTVQETRQSANDTITLPQLGTILRKLDHIEAMLSGQPITDEKLTLPQAAEYLKISESSMRKLIRNHEIPFYRVGGNIEESGNFRFRKSAIDKWVQKQEERNVQGD